MKTINGQAACVAHLLISSLAFGVLLFLAFLCISSAANTKGNISLFNKSHSLRADKAFGRQALCKAQKCTAAGSSMAAGNATAAWPKCSAFLFHCSKDSLSWEIFPVFSKFDSPGINEQGTVLGASQTPNVEWLPEHRCWQENSYVWSCWFCCLVCYCSWAGFDAEASLSPLQSTAFPLLFPSW